MGVASVSPSTTHVKSRLRRIGPYDEPLSGAHGFELPPHADVSYPLKRSKPRDMARLCI